MIIRLDKELSPLGKLQDTTPSAVKVKESSIEDLVVKMPSDIVGEPLLVIARQFSGFSTKEKPDILALDNLGNLVVVELKRDEATEDAATQAVKYAAYCSQLKLTDIRKIFGEYVERFNVNLEGGSAEEALVDFIGGSEGALYDMNRKQRIILVANSFDARVSAVAVWLCKNQIDLKCVRLNLYVDQSGTILLHPEQYLPTPEITSYLPGLRQNDQSRNDQDVKDGITEPFVRELVDGLRAKLASSPFDPGQVDVYRRGWDFRVRMFGKNRAGYYFARKWVRFYLFSPSRAEVELVRSSIGDKQSVNDKEYELGFNVRTQNDVEVLLQLLRRRFENHGDAVETL